MRVTDEMVEVAARAVHDGPLGATDEADFGSNSSSDWCREVARAALEAALAVEGTEAKPVLCQWRSRSVAPDSEFRGWSDWLDCADVEPFDQDGFEKETRELYPTPPAGIREALEAAGDAMDEYYRYWTGGESRGSYDGKPERQRLWAAMHTVKAARATLRGQS